MGEEKRGKFISFIVGMIIGWVGIPIVIHAVYLITIISLVVAYLLK